MRGLGDARESAIGLTHFSLRSRKNINAVALLFRLRVQVQQVLCMCSSALAIAMLSTRVQEPRSTYSLLKRSSTIPTWTCLPTLRSLRHCDRNPSTGEAFQQHLVLLHLSHLGERRISCVQPEAVVQVFNIPSTTMSNVSDIYEFSQNCLDKTILLNIHGTGEITMKAQEMYWYDA
jgi:hypothetical protein